MPIFKLCTKYLKELGFKVGDPINISVETFCSEIGIEGPVAVEGGKTRWNMNGFPQKDTRFVKAPEGILSAKPDEMIVTASVVSGKQTGPAIPPSKTDSSLEYSIRSSKFSKTRSSSSAF